VSGLKVDLRTLHREIEHSLYALQARGHDLKPVFLKARKYLRRDTSDHQKKLEGPTGRWKGLAPSTIAQRMQRAGKQGRARRAHRVGPIRRPRGAILGRKLTNAYQVFIWDEKMIAKSRVAWSGVQAYGGRAGKGAVIPGRDWLWVDDTFLQAVLNICSVRYGELWRKIGVK